MTKEELLALLDRRDDEAEDHVRADEALLIYIGDPDISKAFHAMPKWYD